MGSEGIHAAHLDRSGVVTKGGEATKAHGLPSAEHPTSIDSPQLRMGNKHGFCWIGTGEIPASP
jgi:hypothetical protein